MTVASWPLGVWLSLLLVATGPLVGSAAGTEPDAPVVPLLGKRAPDFTLADAEGKQHSLAELSHAKLVVVAFLGTECPLAKLYGPRLEQLAVEYAERGVRVIGIDANVQDTPEEIATYARDHGLTFPILKDSANVVADRFGAVRTPEVFLLDGKRVARYHGRIDDQFAVAVQKANVGAAIWPWRSMNCWLVTMSRSPSYRRPVVSWGA